MSDNDDTEKKQIPCSENIKNVTTLVIKLFFIMALGSLFSTAHASDENTALQIQLLLSLKGYDLSYRDSNGIDGKIGSKTLEAISAYKETLPINKRNTTDLIDLKKILEDDVRSGNTQPTLDKGNIEQSFKELKDELDKTKTDLNNLISKQSKQEKDYSKDMGLVNLGTNLILAILSILIALTGLFGAAAYKIMKTSLQRDLEHEKKCISVDVMTRVYSFLSEAFYLFYRESLDDQNSQQFISGVGLALSFTDRALLYANILQQEKPSPISKALLINARSHKAYHLATRKSQEDIEKALNMIKEIEEYSEGLLKDEKIEFWANFTDTVAWIYIRSGDPSNEAKGRNIVNNLLHNRDLHQNIKENIYNNYIKADKNASAWIVRP